MNAAMRLGCALAAALAVSGCQHFDGLNGGTPSVASAAARHIGRNPTGQRYLWCQDFVNLSLREAGYRGTGSRAARSVLNWGTAVGRRNAKAGDVVLYPRRGGGHTEIFEAWTAPTTFTAISGNTCGPVGGKAVCRVERSVSEVIAVRRATAKQRKE